MDVFTLTMSLTLAVAGLFLCRDYARFLRGAYAVSGRVTSIQQVFVSRPESTECKISKSHVENGYYPVIEYRSPGGAISFTAIDRSASGRFHVGDDIKLLINKTRRQESRICKTVIVLISMLVLLCLDMSAAALISGIYLSAGQIYLASFVITVSLAILVLYARDQDERGTHQLTRVDGNCAQLCLCEPAAFKNWAFSVRDPVQASKIRSSQLFGATCMCSALAIIVIAFQPLTFAVL